MGVRALQDRFTFLRVCSTETLLGQTTIILSLYNKRIATSDATCLICLLLKPHISFNWTIFLYFFTQRHRNLFHCTYGLIIVLRQIYPLIQSAIESLKDLDQLCCVQPGVQIENCIALRKFRGQIASGTDGTIKDNLRSSPVYDNINHFILLSDDCTNTCSHYKVIYQRSTLQDDVTLCSSESWARLTSFPDDCIFSSSPLHWLQ